MAQKLFVIALLVRATQGTEPCCNKTCELPLVKYFSTDAPHGFCGEACMDPKKFSIYHFFEKNLTLATSDHPCMEQRTPDNTKHYTDYMATVTHGGPGLHVTLDLYAPTNMPDHSCCWTPLFSSLNCVGIPGTVPMTGLFGTGPYCCPKGATNEKPCPSEEAKDPVAKLDDCVTYRRIQNGACGDVCLSSKVGVCSRSIVTKLGGLEEGKCSDAGFTVDKGEQDQAAGPCGTLKIEKWSKQSESVTLKDLQRAKPSGPVAIKDDCQTYRKIQDGSCGDVCLASTIGVCPRSIVTKLGGLEEGKCSDAGFTVDKGEQDQAAGPCGTLKIEKWDKPNESVELKDDCQTYRKVQDGSCGDVCLASTIGVCPRSIVTKLGGLEEGKCSDAGFTVDKGEQDQKAGPCGTLKIEKWDKPNDSITLEDDCQTYRKVQDGACGDVCLASTIGICPRSIVTKMGGLEEGKCSDMGFTVDKGEQDQKAGPCGTLKIEEWAKPGVIVI